MSRQALIFRRRQTQHSGSSEPSVVSDPHTEHLHAGFFTLSAETDWRASSNISAGTTCSGFGFTFRRMASPCCIYYGRNCTLEQVAFRLSRTTRAKKLNLLTRLPVFAQSQPLRAAIGTADNAAPEQLSRVFPLNRVRPAPYACTLDRKPAPMSGFHETLSFPIPLTLSDAAQAPEVRKHSLR